MSSLLESSAVDVGQHVVQFYESDTALVASAGEYLKEAIRAGQVAIVIATDAHLEAFEAHLRGTDVDVTAARREGLLVSLDAAETLGRFMPQGSVDRRAFFDVVGGVVRAAAASGRPVRAYGEMVALLWEAGDVMGAIELETVWNELATQVPFTLYCAYRSESVSGHAHAEALAQVCHLHSSVVPAPALEATWHFAADATAPGDARRLVIDALRRAGHHDHLVDDAQIVVTELASNAVRHARSRFFVSICRTGSKVRIGVCDRSQVLPTMHDDPGTTPSGRGMRLVATLASRWGVDRSPDGKNVWAELGG